MTNDIFHVIVGNGKIRDHRSGKVKAMLQIHTHSVKITYRPYDFKGLIELSAPEAGKLNSACLEQAGSSGYLEPGVPVYDVG